MRPSWDHHTYGNDSGYWPTPQSFDAKATKNWIMGSTWDQKKKIHTLPEAVKMWPTPRANDAEKRGQLSNDIRSGLPAAVQHWRTPQASDWKNKSCSKNQLSTQQQVGGQLNPKWVEWLMGFPEGWTDLKCLGMRGCLKSWLESLKLVANNDSAGI